MSRIRSWQKIYWQKDSRFSANVFLSFFCPAFFCHIPFELNPDKPFCSIELRVGAEGIFAGRKEKNC